MKENTELEEGEACFVNDDDEGNIDIDSLSYIDEKIQNVLGHFQKDFEGGISAENLGAKFGGYGSFLPTYERPSCSSSNPKTSQRNPGSPKSPINLQMEAASHCTKTPSNAPPARAGITSHSSHSSHNLIMPPVGDTLKKETGITSSKVAERSTVKEGSTKMSGNSTDRRPLKFKIKMKSNVLEQNKAAIYSGLGLDNSPSSSMGNSPVESEGMLPPVSKANAEGSPSEIFKVMTSFPIPGAVLLSPLHESLLFLIKKESVIGDSRCMSSPNGHREPCSMSTDESDSFAGDRHSKKKVRIVRKSEKQLELNHMNGSLSGNDTRLITKKKLGNETPDRKDFLSNDLKCTPLSSSICDAGENAEVTGKASMVSKQVSKDGLRGRVVSVKAVKEGRLESIAGQDFEKIEKQNAGNGPMKKVLEHKMESPCKDNSTDRKNSDMRNTLAVSNKDEGGIVKCKVVQDPQKRETNLKVKVVSEGKNKSKDGLSPGIAKAVTRKDSSGGNNNVIVSEKESAGNGISSGRNKINKAKSLKDNKVRDSNRDSSKGKKSERKVDGPSGNSAIKNADIDNFEKQHAFGAKVKDRPKGNKVVNPMLSKPSLTDASSSFPIAEDKPAPEMIPSEAAASQLIPEDWVCCDRCQQWRLLPTGIKPEHLPEKWLCSMQTWLRGMNRCDLSEDETTKALRALYQMPISDGQNNMQSHATGTEIGVTSADAFQFDTSHKKSSSEVIRGKKKYVIKERTIVGTNNDILQSSNSAKIDAPESGKNRRLTDMNQHPADSAPMKISCKHSIRFNNSIEEKHLAKEKEKPINGGDTKYTKLKRKMETDQYSLGTPKKSKTEDACYADKQLNSRNELLPKANGMDMMKYDEYCLSEDALDKLSVPVKKGRDQVLVLSGGGSLDVKVISKNDGSMKKRKLNGLLDNEEHHGSFSMQGDKQCGGEGNASGFRKEKKPRILNSEAKSVSDGDHKLNKGGGTEVRYVDKSQPPKHRKNIASRQVSDGIGLLGRDSLAATSSSSKISGSHKVKINPEDVRGSPVESITSSPLRASNMDRHSLAVVEISGKDAATKGGLSSTGSRRSVDNRAGKLSVKLKGDKISCNSNPASHKLSSKECGVEDAKHKTRVQAKTTADVKNDHLLEGGVPLEQNGNCANGMCHEEKVIKKNQENQLTWQKSGKVTSLHSKEKDRKPDSVVGPDKMKVSAPENGYTENGGRYDSALPSYHVSCPETRNDSNCSSRKSKCEIDKISQKAGRQNDLKQKDLENSAAQMDVQCSNGSKTISQQNRILDFEAGNIANNVLLSGVEDAKRETLCMGSRSAPVYQKGDMCNEHPVSVSDNGDMTMLMQKSAAISSNVGVDRNSGNFGSDQRLTMSTLAKTNSGQTASFNTLLEEATKLKETADIYKNSGFEFESNETYFKAALMFLHGAYLLENHHSESSRHADMSHLQVYATTAKLFKSCANAYERRKEVAAAALAYKCMEVAYMRVVYCKHSSTNRDLHELQSTLQMIPQGESPSSSASDLDNLNNQAAGDKATLLRGNTLVASNQVISARTRPNLVRLLDLTQDMNFAMEASSKCQSTFEAASEITEEARYRACITSIRRVIDFSFQDIDELVRLAWIATKSISHSGLDGARD